MQKRVKAVAAALSLVLFNLGAAHATVVNQFFDFNNNQLPPGWGSLGPTVQNGRLLLSSGNTYAPIDTSKASSFSIDYDAGLGPNSGASAWLWGGGNATYNAGRLLLVNSNGATYIVGSSATATLSSGEARTVPVGSGEYHVSSTFANGQVSYSLRDLATGLGVSVNNAPAPYLTLAGVSGTSGIDKLFGFFSGQGTSWVDNVRVTITNNQFRFTITGTAGSNYVVQATTNLAERLSALPSPPKLPLQFSR